MCLDLVCRFSIFSVMSDVGVARLACTIIYTPWSVLLKWNGVNMLWPERVVNVATLWA